MKLRDAPVGLFYSADGELCLKTAYSYPWGMDAYVVRTGEVFWGTAVDADERGNLDVTPVPMDVQDMFQQILDYACKKIKN